MKKKSKKVVLKSDGTFSEPEETLKAKGCKCCHE